MEENNKNNMTNELVEAGLKLASSAQAGSHYGTEYLDRTIYYTVYVTDVNGNIMVDGSGNKIVRNQVLYLAGSYLSKAEMEYAVAVEEQFKAYNDKLRKDMDRQGIRWRFKKSDQKALTIQGVTGV